MDGSILGLGLDEVSRCSNNKWLYDGNKDQVIVFVHGILSSSEECWYRKPESTGRGVYWPEMVRKDRRFSQFSIYMGGYYTAIESGAYEVSDCAEELYSALQRPDKDTGKVVLNHKTVVFVCHSMGGIVVRYMLTARPWAFQQSRIALALIASPSYGSQWANRLDLLADYFQHVQGKQLKWGNWNLKDLDGRFRTVLEGKGIPQLVGAEACENRFILKGKWFPSVNPVVERDSAGVYFGRVRMLPDTDHFTCVKPNDMDHPAHQFLVDFCDGLIKDKSYPGPPSSAAIAQPTEQAGDTVTAAFGVKPAPKPMPKPQPKPQPAATSAADEIVCGGCHWDVQIDEEGDAYNEMTYEGVTRLAGQSNLFDLPAAEVQSGHTTPYELIQGDDRTSVGTSLKQLNPGAHTKIEMQVQFSQAPSKQSPAGFCLTSYDWNVFAMNMEEYRQKPGWRADGLDFAEKLVPQAWGAVSIVIKFPKQMIFAKPPFFEACEPSDNFDEKRNEELTLRYQNCFYYSRSLKQAVLVVPEPRAPFSYRISWLVGESRVKVTSALVPEQRRRQRAFSQGLLRMRKALNAGEGGSFAEQANLVNSALATVAKHVQERIGVKEPLDPASLELSLMVLDEDDLEIPATGNKKLPVLRIVAGTRLDDPLYRKLALFVGDGNAGRAWKRRMARIFDDTETDPKRHIYVPLPNVPRHQFLISVPLIDRDSDALIYGILNVGTFSEQQAEIMRPLGAVEEIESLTTYAQSFVLTRLLEGLNI